MKTLSDTPVFRDILEELARTLQARRARETPVVGRGVPISEFL